MAKARSTRSASAASKTLKVRSAMSGRYVTPRLGSALAVAGTADAPAEAPVRSGFALEAIRLNRQWGLGHRIIADATGAAPSTVRDWLTGRSAPTGERALRVADLAAIADRLGRVVTPEYVPVWLVKPIYALDDERPVDVIRTGRVRDVSKVISGLESPVAG